MWHKPYFLEVDWYCFQDTEKEIEKENKPVPLEDLICNKNILDIKSGELQ